MDTPRFVRYGKSSSSLLGHKKSFFEQDGMHREEAQRVGALYLRQPRRTRCKCCEDALGPPSFTKLGIDYIICARCGHLNGAHEDTEAFCRGVYVDDGGAHGRFYGAESKQNYINRTNDIYGPKADWLIDALCASDEDPTRLSYADFGAGAGYFVSALLRHEIETVRGFEMSGPQLDLAERMLGGGRIEPCELNETIHIAATVKADVVSLVHVLEHMREPRGMLSALKHNPSVKYLFVAVPLFSPCGYFEMIFPTVFNRQLSGGHTHLFSEQSLDWLCREFGFERVAEWWFGTDVVDWYRSVMIRLRQEPETANMADDWAALWAPAIDGMQLELDRRHMSSEIHMLLRIER